MGWGNSQRRRGAAPRHYKLPPPGPGFLIRQTGVAYGDGSPDVDQDAIPTRVRVYSLDGETLGETTVDLTPGKQDDTIAVRVDRPSSNLAILERGVHVPERGFFRLKGAADDPHAPIGGNILLTRANRQRYKIPIYNLTTGHPLPDIIWYYGKTNGRTGKKNPREHWVPVEVSSIISRELWEKAQERRERNKETAERNTKYEYLVGRRVTCGHCGNKMVGRLMSQKYWYYYCPVHKGQRVEGECDNRYFNVAQVDKAVWSWVKELLLDPEALRRNLKVQQAKQEEANKPLHSRLAVIDDLLADNRRQLEKLLDLYLAEEFDKEMLTERKTRLEATVTALQKERAGLVTTLEAMVLSDDQIMTIEDFARKVAEGLRTAEEDFEAKRRIIDLLDVQVTLAIEDGEKIAYVHCLVDEAELSIVGTTSKSLARPKVWSSSRRGWLASPEYSSRKG